MEPTHEPVLLAEVLEALAVRPGGLYVDGTLGLGGHAEAILERSAPDGRLVGVDRDQDALGRAQARLARFGDRVRTHHADFRALPTLVSAAHGILLDLGVSSLQLDDPARGFSFRHEGPLDMRMDPSGGETAADVLRRTNERDLADLIYAYGEERASRKVARAIVDERRHTPLLTTGDLARLVRRVVRRTPGGIDPATRTFQALRIRVNRELEGLGACLAALVPLLVPGGRLVVIAFHSLEDREVKLAFRAAAQAGGVRVLTRKPITAGEDEVRRNPRARSARLRALEREAA